MADGFFAGGLANSLSKQRYPRTQMMLEKRKARAERRENLRERTIDAVKRLDESMTKIREMRDTAVANGQEAPQELNRLFNRLKKQRDRMSTMAGLPVQTMPRLEKIPPADLTPEQQREQEVATERATARAQAEGQTAGRISSARRVQGVVESDPELREALQGQNVLPSRAPSFSNYAISVDGKTQMQTFDENDPEDAAQIKAMRDDPNVRIQRMPTSVQAATVEDATGTAISEGDREDSVANLPDIRQNMVEAGQLAQQVEELGAGAGFIRRNIVSKVGGLVGQFSPQLENAIGNLVGVSPEDARRFEIDARRTAAKLIAPITGEESGRKTETEREIANRVSALDVATASPTQIRSALPAIYTLWLQRLTKEEIKAGNRLTFEVVDEQGNANEEGMLQLVDEMESFGFPEDTQRRILSNFVVLQRELKQIDLGRDGAKVGDPQLNPRSGIGPAS